MAPLRSGGDSNLGALLKALEILKKWEMVCLGTFLTMMEETGCSNFLCEGHNQLLRKNVIHLTVISICTATAI
jgi:hypothetical protein